MSVELALEWDYAPNEMEEPAGEGVLSSDALIESLRRFACVDIDYIAERIGVEVDEAAALLSDAVFQDPYTLEWQTAEEYLSGDLYRKLSVAVKVDAATGRFGRNICALKGALPPRVFAEAIYVTLGSPWLPEDIVRDFVAHLMDDRLCSCEVLHDPATGSWDIKGKGAYRHRPESRQIFGTKRKLALDIVEDILNGRDVRVTDEVSCPQNKSGKKNVLNHGETVMALEKQRLICEEFDVWVWADPGRRKALEDLFNVKFCGYQPRRFDGGILEFPGMADGFELRPYQKDAVMRILMERDVLVAHDVGAGKTYTAIAAMMELRRMGISVNNLVVVPNNVIGQWASLFEAMYPKAEVLVVSPKMFVPKKRQAVLADIRDGSHDAVLMAYSSFNLIPLSREDAIQALDRRIKELEEAAKDPVRCTSTVKRELKACRKKRDQLENDDVADSLKDITFDQLGVTRLFVDEAQNFKNLPLSGLRFRARGLNRKGSAMCQHMHDAIRCVQRSGGGAVFLSGTIMTNSIADCFVFQTYLQPGTLNVLGLQSFDAWIGMFARKVTGFEIDVDTSTYRHTTRFGGFGNLGELSSLLANIADFHRLGAVDGLPNCQGRIDVLTPKGEQLERYLQHISERTDRVRQGLVKPTEDNLLMICGDGRKAAVDMRNVEEDIVCDGQTKVTACAENVYRIWLAGAAFRLTQLVFCDISTPKEGFNVYDELKSLLVSMGVPSTEVAFVHDAKTIRERERLFAAVREGRVRVLVGSTFKLGLGVNVQDRLVAAHHLDVPWRPADMTQREGRILRQGNQNARVEIYRYVTEGSFDAYSWQLLENKQRAIDELLSGTYEGGYLESDIGETALSYGEIKALAVNNPLLKERVEVANELQRNLILQRRTASVRAEMQDEIREKTDAIVRLEVEVERYREDAEYHKGPGSYELGKVEKALMRRFLLQAMARNAFRARETVIPRYHYRGFEIVLPAGMDPEKPYLWLRRRARYKVDLGEVKEMGVLVRMDNVLDGIRFRIEDIEGDIAELYRSWEAMEAELDKKASDRTKQIRDCQARLARIDMELEERK